MKVKLVDAKGAKVASGFTWKSDKFKKGPNQQLVAEVYEAGRASARSNNATSLDRSEVRGGGRKPWKQKGTGRARHGSIRSPIWRGGGVTFGPNNGRNYTKSVNKSAAKSAFRSALQLKQDNIYIVKSMPDFKEPSTKEANEFITKVAGEDRRRVLIVASEPSPVLVKSCSNLPATNVVSANALNIRQLVDADQVLIEEAATTSLESRLV